MTLKKRSLSTVVKAALLPVVVGIAMLQVNFFSVYPSFSPLFWLTITIFYFPVIIAALALPILPMTTRKSHLLDQCSGVIFGNRALRIFGFLSVVFIFAIMYRFLVIGSVLELGITGARYEDAISGAGGGWITGIYSLTIGAPAFLLLACIDHYKVNRKIPVLFLLISVLGFASTFLSGGRNPFLISAVFVLAAGWVYPASSIREVFRGRSVRSLLFKNSAKFFFICFLVFSLYIFYDRALLRADSMFERAKLHAMENGLQLLIEDIPVWLPDSIYIIMFYMHSYMTTAFFYMDFLLNHGMPKGHLGGGYNFLIPALVIENLTGWDVAPNHKTDLPIHGAYYTLAGSIFVDFGFVGLLLSSVLIPLLCLIFVNLARTGTTSAVPMAAVFVTVLILSPLYNAASLGSGFSLLFLSLIYILFRRRSL